MLRSINFQLTRDWAGIPLGGARGLRLWSATASLLAEVQLTYADGSQASLYVRPGEWYALGEPVRSASARLLVGTTGTSEPVTLDVGTTGDDWLMAAPRDGARLLAAWAGPLELPYVGTTQGTRFPLVIPTTRTADFRALAVYLNNVSVRTEARPQDGGLVNTTTGVWKWRARGALGGEVAVLAATNITATDTKDRGWLFDLEGGALLAGSTLTQAKLRPHALEVFVECNSDVMVTISGSVQMWGMP